MFDATLFLSRHAVATITRVKAHDCTMRLQGRPSEPTLEALAELATEQVGTVRVTSPKVEVAPGRTFQPIDELPPVKAGLFIEGTDPEPKTGRKGTGKAASEAHAAETASNGKS